MTNEKRNISSVTEEWILTQTAKGNPFHCSLQGKTKSLEMVNPLLHTQI